MAKTVAGTLTENERDEIQRLNYRKQTLQTLFRSLADEHATFNPQLYDKMMNDMIETEQRTTVGFATRPRSTAGSPATA